MKYLYAFIALVALLALRGHFDSSLNQAEDVVFLLVAVAVPWAIVTRK